MPSRIYFYDAVTGDELRDHPLQGVMFTGTDANGASPKTGVQYTDTAWSVVGQKGRTPVTITAADFPGHLVVAKIWGSGDGSDARYVERRLLITERDGFVPLNKAPAKGRWERDSYGQRFRDHERGEILGDRRALEWIAAHRPRANPRRRKGVGRTVKTRRTPRPKRRRNP